MYKSKVAAAHSAQWGEISFCRRILVFIHAHCSNMKMNGKKLIHFQFNYPGLLGTSPMSKKEFYNWTLEKIPFIHLAKQMDGS